MRKAGWILIMAFMALFLSACGAKLDAEAIVEAGGRGSREFTVSISKNDLKTLGNPSITEVDRVIKAAIPDCMSYAYTEDGKQYIATFELNFDSEADYEDKLNTFCKQEAKVECSIGESPFAQEILFTENLTSEEMMSWLVDALIDGGLLAEKYRDSVFESCNTELKVGGMVFDAGSGRIRVQKQEYTTIESIDIYTEPVGEGKFNRSIRLNLSAEEFSGNPELINAYLEGSVPEGGSGVWEDGEKGSKTFVVSLTSLTPEEMTKAMKEYTRSDACLFEDEDAAEAGSVFCKDAAFYEELNVTAFGCNPQNTVNINYMINEKSAEGELRSGNEETVLSPADVRELGGARYLVYSFGEVPRTTVRADLVQYYHFRKIDYTLDAGGADGIRKEIVFYFDEDGTGDVGEVYDRIRMLGSTDSDAAKIGIGLDDKALTLSFEGTATEINRMTSAITGDDGNSVSYAYEDQWLSPTTVCIVSDSVNLGGFVYQDPKKSEYWQIPVNYKANIYGFGKKMIPDQGLLKKKSRGFAGKFTSDTGRKFTYRTNRVNRQALLWYLLIALSLAGVVGGIYFKIAAARMAKKVPAAVERLNPEDVEIVGKTEEENVREPMAIEVENDLEMTEKC